MRIYLSLSILLVSLLKVASQPKSLVIEEPITQLTVSGNIHLQLIRSDNQKLDYTQEENGETMEIDMEKGSLSLKTRSELSSSAEAINAKLYYTDITDLEVIKGSRVQSADTLKTGILKLEVENGGKVELMIHVDSLSARVNQGSDIILYGKTRSQKIQAYTWGNFLGYELLAVDTYVKAATGAQVKVTASRLLDANATSKAYIGYAGEPVEKKVKTSVGGEVTLLSE